MSQNDEKLTPAQQEVIDALKVAYTRYNTLASRIIDVTSRDYISVIELKQAILASLKECLYEAGAK